MNLFNRKNKEMTPSKYFIKRPVVKFAFCILALFLQLLLCYSKQTAAHVFFRECSEIFSYYVEQLLNNFIISPPVEIHISVKKRLIINKA